MKTLEEIRAELDRISSLISSNEYDRRLIEAVFAEIRPYDWIGKDLPATGFNEALKKLDQNLAALLGKK